MYVLLLATFVVSSGACKSISRRPPPRRLPRLSAWHRRACDRRPSTRSGSPSLAERRDNCPAQTMTCSFRSSRSLTFALQVPTKAGARGCPPSGGARQGRAGRNDPARTWQHRPDRDQRALVSGVQAVGEGGSRTHRRCPPRNADRRADRGLGHLREVSAGRLRERRSAHGFDGRTWRLLARPWWRCASGDPKRSRQGKPGD
jgi:hypothetical protein